MWPGDLNLGRGGGSRSRRCGATASLAVLPAGRSEACLPLGLGHDRVREAARAAVELSRELARVDREPGPGAGRIEEPVGVDPRS
jgi:hypothetical protein